MSNNPHFGSSFEDWLRTEGLYEEVTEQAIKRIATWQAGNFVYRTQWSEEDEEWVATCSAFPSLSHLDKDQDAALRGIEALVADVCAESLKMADSTERDREMASEIFFGFSEDWFQQAVKVIAQARAEARAEEREACARVVEAYQNERGDTGYDGLRWIIACLIRNREDTNPQGADPA